MSSLSSYHNAVNTYHTDRELYDLMAKVEAHPALRLVSKAALYLQLREKLEAQGHQVLPARRIAAQQMLVALDALAKLAY